MDGYRQRFEEAAPRLFQSFRDAAYCSPWLMAAYKLLKWCVRQVAGTTELVRLCAASARQKSASAEEGIPLLERPDGGESDDDAATAFDVERSILFSRVLKEERRQLEDGPGSVDAVFLSVLRKKCFPLAGDPTSPLAIELRRCLNRISESHKLLNELNARAKTMYSNSDAAHEKKLLQLWNLLMPREPLPERFTNSWQKIGFQGKDPATDFRGMGMLGLDDLHYFASNYPAECGEVLRSSRHEVSWYSFAIVGINITAWTINALRARKLQYHLYRYGPTKDFHHELYCYVFVNFNKHWSSKVPDVTVMDFELVFEDFTKMLDQRIVQHKPMFIDETSPVFAENAKRK